MYCAPAFSSTSDRSDVWMHGTWVGRRGSGGELWMHPWMIDELPTTTMDEHELI
jgi:hypothetical protein